MEANNVGAKWKVKSNISYKDLYNHYKSTCDFPVDRKVWIETLEILNKEFMRLIIEEGKEMRMPYLNTLSVRKSKNVNTKTLDYQHYNKTGEKRMLTNEHSDGFQAWFYWRKVRCMVPGKAPYKFTMSRDNQRALAKEMKQFNGHAKYAEHYG